MFDRAIAFGPGHIDIAQRHIVLEIDESLVRIIGRRRRTDRFGAGGCTHRLDVLPRFTGHERLGIRVPVERCAARLHMKVHHRREPARHRQQVRRKAHALAADRGTHRRQAMPRAFGRLRHGVVVDRKAAVRPGRRGPGIEHRHHFGPGVAERDGGTVGVIVVGGDHHAPARHHAKAADVGAHRLAQHHAGPIVMREGQWPF